MPREIIVADEISDRVSINDDGTALRIGETETHIIEVIPMLYNDRIIWAPKRNPLFVDRFWCYERGAAAVLAALVWDGAADTEPVGWIKSWDQRYSEEFLARQPGRRG